MTNQTAAARPEIAGEIEGAMTNTTAARIAQIEARLLELAAIEKQLRQSRRKFSPHALEALREVATGIGPHGYGAKPSKPKRPAPKAKATLKSVPRGTALAAVTSIVADGGCQDASSPA